MTNKELDKYLAENLMGYESITGNVEGSYVDTYKYFNKDRTYGFVTFSPTKVISDTFQVVEKMQEKGFLMQLFSTIENNKDSLEWVAAFFLKWAKGYEAITKTPELAISLAAKKAIADRFVYLSKASGPDEKSLDS